MYYVALVMAVTSTVFYHVLLKRIPPQVNPVAALAGTYLVAALACILAFPLFKSEGGLLQNLKDAKVGNLVLLGVAIAGIELGVLYAYRLGGAVSKLSLVINTLVALVLVVVGLVFYKEHLSAGNIIGIVLCLGGALLIAR
ncbi:EamA family transporter [Ruminococcaceae bacterium OttesenSCG-928-D13]|nr:EamA family transporter [Ruminococcaceae bacterium OttesenSCG-928-D13]